MTLKRHFTVTCYIIEKSLVLLLWHAKLQKWLPPGGHLEENENPITGLHREVLEETGLEIELISDNPLKIDRPNAVSLPRPFLILLEQVPPHKETPAHEHIDLIYLGRPIGGVLTEGNWFTKEEVMSLEGDQTIFVETQETIRFLLEGGKEQLGAYVPQAGAGLTGA